MWGCSFPSLQRKKKRLESMVFLAVTPAQTGQRKPGMHMMTALVVAQGSLPSIFILLAHLKSVFPFSVTTNIWYTCDIRCKSSSVKLCQFYKCAGSTSTGSPGRRQHYTTGRLTPHCSSVAANLFQAKISCSPHTRAHLYDTQSFSAYTTSSCAIAPAMSNPRVYPIS